MVGNVFANSCMRQFVGASDTVTAGRSHTTESNVEAVTLHRCPATTTRLRWGFAENPNPVSVTSPPD
jgi:hypothetical protein